MSDPRSTYPKATAWTFLLDTPAAEAAGGASGTKAPPPAVTGGGDRPRRAAAAGAAKAAASRRKPSLTGSSCSGNEEMGAACSKSNDAVANKENMGELEEVLVPNGGDTSTGGDSEDADCDDLGAGAGSEPLQASKEGPLNERAVLGGAALDSTAFLSPEPQEQELGECEAEDAALVAVENGIARLRGGGHAGSAGDGRMRYEDKSAWIARNLEMLPTRGAAVEVDQLKQVREMEREKQRFSLWRGIVHMLSLL